MGVTGAGICLLGGIAFFYNSMDLWVARTVLILALLLWGILMALSIVFVLASRAFQNQRDLC